MKVRTRSDRILLFSAPLLQLERRAKALDKGHRPGLPWWRTAGAMANLCTGRAWRRCAAEPRPDQPCKGAGKEPSTRKSVSLGKICRVVLAAQLVT